MRWKFRFSKLLRSCVHVACDEFPLFIIGLCAEIALCCGAGELVRESESDGLLDGRALCRFSELLEESEKETL
jgi:hypothetical protein